jgi:desumoylating isopeptidase 1
MIKATLTQNVLPYLKSRFTPTNKLNPLPSATVGMLSSWSVITGTLGKTLPTAELFPLVDMWRLAFLDPAVDTWCTSLTTPEPITVLLTKALSDLDHAPRSYLLTLLRLVSNTFTSHALARRLLSDVALQGEPFSSRKRLTELLVPTLLHQDAAVRTAAASLAFNVAAYFQKRRVEKVKNGFGITLDGEEDGDWEVEMVSAIVEAIDREKGSEEVGK